MGAIGVETIYTCYWSDCLSFRVFLVVGFACNGGAEFELYGRALDWIDLFLPRLTVL